MTVQRRQVAVCRAALGKGPWSLENRPMRILTPFLHKQRPRPQAQTGQSGFTLIEAMVVMAIVAILAAMAGPALQTLIRNNRLSSAMSLLQVSLNQARGEAVRRGTDARVTVAAATTAGEWKNGWTVFVDTAKNANAGVAPTSDSANYTRLEVAGPLPSANMQYGQTGTDKYFSFNGQGRLVTTTGGAGANRSFWFFEGDSDKYCVVISVTGRVRTEKMASTVTTCGTS